MNDLIQQAAVIPSLDAQEALAVIADQRIINGDTPFDVDGDLDVKDRALSAALDYVRDATGFQPKDPMLKEPGL